MTIIMKGFTRGPFILALNGLMGTQTLIALQERPDYFELQGHPQFMDQVRQSSHLRFV